MKQTILISIVASSSILFAATSVDGVTIEQSSSITASTTIGGIVNQAQTNIDATEGSSSKINRLDITQTNAIKNGSIISGTVADPVIINQGKTTITNSKISKLSLHSNNVIDSSTINGNMSQVNQGNFIITDSNATDSTIGDIDIYTKNTIGGSSSVANSTIIQATTIVTSSDINDLSSTQTNTIDSMNSNSALIAQGKTIISN